MTKKKGIYSKVIIVVVIVLNVLFTAAVLHAFEKTGNEPAALIAAWFSFTTGELLMLTSIKKAKEKKKGSGEKDENKLES
ncbi:MAG TPA: hypothetical protein GXX75_09120 [Clostridiales bacterium]|nr:hypothetical protein [Clostridiales bacterium]